MVDRKNYKSPKKIAHPRKTQNIRLQHTTTFHLQQVIIAQRSQSVQQKCPHYRSPHRHIFSIQYRHL